jgi:ABC-type multidrug transport system ATPase subunit
LTIILENTGKRFNKEWIFRNLNYQFAPGNKYAILGTNGCGKSTLLQLISGACSPTEGKIKYIDIVSRKENIQSPFRSLGFAAPYLELPEEMTWREAVLFQGRFKNFLPGFSPEKIISISGLAASSEKEIRNFSSGMKQRARLALAILSDTPLLLLDEPSTNLDANAVKWYQQLIEEFANKKTILVCSNYNAQEYPFCKEELVMGNYP